MIRAFQCLMVFGFLFSSQMSWACTWDSDCDSGYHCNSTTKKCTMGSWPNGGCTWDSDCSSGYVCQSKSCVQKGGSSSGCTWDSDCSDGYECENHECQSRGNAGTETLSMKVDVVQNILNIASSNNGKGICKTSL
ncbi:MAG TPA: Dickkopf N-terminal cysteine-rich domain-containing protein [Bdellovibrio sp.]|nr:Dickkopf N-terminal cysteine-rich domain-containing protein [Bdellovibrio sp.]